VALCRLAARLLPLALALAAPAATGPAAGGGGRPRVLALEVKEAITAGTAEYVLAGLRRAEAERFDAVAVTLDTPGGQLDVTRELVQALLASPVPVVVWVGPAGARAGSAGVFVLMAAHVAAMHPTSNVGAAHPVMAGGQDVGQAAGKDMARKVENDTAAFARSVAEARGRSAAWADQAVRESVSATAPEALRARVIDLVAASLPEALDAAAGRAVVLPGGTRPLATRGAVLEAARKTIRQQLLSALADPGTVALLTLVGALGLALELYHPGAIAPGAVGALCLLLAVLAMRVIPVNAGAALLVVAGVGLLVAEGYLPAHGLAALGGGICVVLGTLFFVDRESPDYLFDPATFTLSPWLVWPTPIALSALLAFVALKVARASRRPLQLGAPGLVGAAGQALGDVGPGGGEVFVHGEYWRARSAAPIAAGTRVRVVALDGLTATVEPAPP
jgi:membrane-bound serine protease (ClpP class)